MSTSNAKLTLVTCSYLPDFDRCARLARTVDTLTGDDIEHIIIVPERDLPTFNSLKTDRRRIISVQAAVPGNFKQLPVSNKWWLFDFHHPVRGWIMQQITKLSAALVAKTDFLMYADSDLQLIAPFKADDVINDNKLRLFSDPGAMSDGEHLNWHHVASRLLGLPEQYAGNNYNGQLITWRRNHLLALHSKLESIGNAPWPAIIAKQRTVSEYILFGNFVDRAGDYAKDYYRTNEPLVYSCWTPEQLEAFKHDDSPIPEGIIALHIQSNLKRSTEDEENLIAERIAAKTASHK